MLDKKGACGYEWSIGTCNRNSDCYAIAMYMYGGNRIFSWRSREEERQMILDRPDMRKVHIRQAVDVCVVHGFIFL